MNVTGPILIIILLALMIGYAVGQTLNATTGALVYMPGGVKPDGMIAQIQLNVDGLVRAKCE